MTTLDEMWQRLEAHQPYADKYGYGPAWMIMCKTRKPQAAWDAACAAGDAAWAAWDAARAARDAACAARGAARGAAWAADVAVNHIEIAEKFYNKKKRNV